MTKPALILHVQPHWVELMPGVEILVEPLRRSVLQEIHEEVYGAKGDSDDQEAPAGRRTAAQVSQQMTLTAQRVIRDWRGIGDADGEPLAPTPDMIAELMEDQRAFMAFQHKVVLPAMGVVEEGNG